jgi:para-aminobenzoate synthetase component 1
MFIIFRNFAPQTKPQPMRIDGSTLQNLMNAHGAARKPFVFAVDYDMQRCIFIDNPLTNNEVRWATESANNGVPTLHDSSKLPALTVVHAPTFDEYAQKFAVVRDGLVHGNSFLTNLTVGVEVDCSLSFDEIYAACDAKYKFLIPNEFVCFSPERFVRVVGDSIYTYPMKGTIDAAVPDAERVLMNDHKEVCEHNTIVDLLRNDLSMVADNVRVSRFRYVDRIKTHSGEILQTSSEIVGDLAPDWHSRMGDMLFTLLPAGSICGAPKRATLKLIADAEQSSRGWYTGVWGYYDGSSLDTAVMIRCLAVRDEKTYFHSGGGITANSCAKDEYNEVMQKIYLPIK